MPIEVPFCFLFGGAERGCYKYLSTRDFYYLGIITNMYSTGEGFLPEYTVVIDKRLFIILCGVQHSRPP
jgi:hypothetical protein